MSVVYARRASVFRQVAKCLAASALVLSMASCNSASRQEQVSQSEVNPISHVARFIATPFRGSVERDLRSLIREVANQKPDCDSSPDREKLISELISPSSVNVLQHQQDEYWDQALPTEIAQKQEVLDSVEQSLAVHMNNIKQSITATGLKIGDNNTRIALLAAPSIPKLPAANSAGALLASRSAPLPVMKHTDRQGG
jgi:hypothetical protein